MTNVFGDDRALRPLRARLVRTNYGPEIERTLAHNNRRGQGRPWAEIYAELPYISILYVSPYSPGGPGLDFFISDELPPEQPAGLYQFRVHYFDGVRFRFFWYNEHHDRVSFGAGHDLTADDFMVRGNVIMFANEFNGVTEDDAG